MVTCTLGEKRYTVDFVTGRALREIGEAEKMYMRLTEVTQAAMEGKTVEDAPKIEEAMDVMVRWFCLLFKNQFTPDEFYDGYPLDSAMHDIAYAMLVVRAQTTEILNEFPMKPAAGKSGTMKG